MTAQLRQNNKPPHNDGEEYEDYAENLLRNWPAESLLQANLDSLRLHDELLARQIGQVKLPEAVKPAVANDGSFSYRLRQPDGRWYWLGYSSVPVISAKANLERIKIGRGNIVTQGIGHGGEIEAVLRVMSSSQAVIVTETEILHLNLVLRLRDFSNDLGKGRLVVLHGEDPGRLIEEYYIAHPGYNLIDLTLAWTWLSEKENRHFSQIVSSASNRYLQQNLPSFEKQLQQQRERENRTKIKDTLACFQPGQIQALRIANCTQAYTPVDMGTSRDALAGLRQLGAITDWLILDRPDVVSPYAQLERLNRFQPHLILLVDTLRGDITPALDKTAICVTLLRQRGAWAAEGRTLSQRMGKYDFVFCPWLNETEKLKQAGLPSERLAYLPWAAHEGFYKPTTPTESDRERYGADVSIVSDRFSTDPLTYGIKLATHQKLWENVCAEIRKAPAQYFYDRARQYLNRAQRYGIELREEELRKYYIELIQNYLGDSILIDTYCQELDRAGVDLRIWGWGVLGKESASEVVPYWQESPVSHRFGGTIEPAGEIRKLYNAARIHLYISGKGYPDGTLLNGIAAGAFFLVKSHPNDKRPGGIGEFFDLGEELITFETPQDLVRKVNHYLKNESERQRITQAARTKLLEQHCYRHRMETMLGYISQNLNR